MIVAYIPFIETSVMIVFFKLAEVCLAQAITQETEHSHLTDPHYL